MSSPKWTPGPWEACVRVPGCTDIVSAGGAIANVQLWTDCKRGEVEESDANARLIAAAPDMFEALHDLLECVHVPAVSDCYSDPLRKAVDQARLALTRARGEGVS